MTLFQWLTLAFIVSLVCWELLGLRRDPGQRRSRLLRGLLWLSAGIAVARPDFVQDIASALGIGRGADVVLYLFVLSFMLTAFYFYSRTVQLERRLTALVRHIAIREARKQPGGDGEPLDRS